MMEILYYVCVKICKYLFLKEKRKGINILKKVLREKCFSRMIIRRKISFPFRPEYRNRVS